jgi:hypothetical protein
MEESTIRLFDDGKFNITVLLLWSEGVCSQGYSLNFLPFEECRLLGYKNPVRTSQETHYISVTELSRLMLCKI